MRKKRSRKIPLKQLDTPEDLAKACLSLASNMSNYVTRQTIHVKGGLYN